MRVFVTGASGFVGSAVTSDLVAAGHSVTGLVRSEVSASAITALGARAYRGELTDHAAVRAGAASADAIIHCGFNHDFSRFATSCLEDGQLIEALGEEYAGSNRPIVVTSGIGILPSGVQLTEESRPATGAAAHPRAATERAVEKIRAVGVNVSTVRLPPSTHGAGDHGFVPMLIDMARKSGVSAYPGEGKNRWPAVHRLDAAAVYRKAMERGVAGAYYHAVAEEGVLFREIAEMIGKNLKLPVVAKPGEEAAAHFGWFAHFAAMDKPASSSWTRETLDWAPTHQDLLTDISANYFQPHPRTS